MMEMEDILAIYGYWDEDGSGVCICKSEVFFFFFGGSEEVCRVSQVSQTDRLFAGKQRRKRALLVKE